MAYRPVTPRWGEVLWADLEQFPPTERIRIAGDWIAYVTHRLLPELGEYRRAEIAKLLDDPDWDPQRLAETIGGRADAVKRLAKEGRRLRGQTPDDSAS